MKPIRKEKMSTSKLHNQSHLKAELLYLSHFIDLTEHSVQLAEMLAASLDCCLHPYSSFQNMTQSATRQINIMIKQCVCEITGLFIFWQEID